MIKLAATVVAFAVLSLGMTQEVRAEAQEHLRMAQEILTVPTVSVPDVRGMDKKDYMLLDVRTPEEYAEGHIEGAQSVPLDTLEAKMSALPKDKKIVVYCKSGRRSAMAVGLLQKKGFAKAVSMDGGFTAWQNQP